MDKYSLPSTLIRMKVEHFKSQPSDRELKNFYADYCSQACPDLKDKKDELEAIAKALADYCSQACSDPKDKKDELEAVGKALADYYSQACSGLEDKKDKLEAIAKALSAGSGRTPKNGLNGKQALDALRRLDEYSHATAWGIIAEDLVKILRKQGGKTRLEDTDKASESTLIDQKFYGRWVQLKIDQHGYDPKTACEEVAAEEVDAQNNPLYKTPRDRELRGLNILKSYTAYCKKPKKTEIYSLKVIRLFNYFFFRLRRIRRS